MKKKMLCLLLSGFLVLGLAACGSTQEAGPAGSGAGQQSSSPAQAEQSSQAGEEGALDSELRADDTSLVVYFSMPETTDPDNMTAEEEHSIVVIDGEVLGNTQYVAYVIQEHIDADMFRIEPVTPYPMDHAKLEAVATEEKRNNAMPEIAAEVENIEQYSTIFLGYPNWYGDMPRIVYSFLEQYDLSGKTIVPFVTLGGSGFSNTIQTIAGLQPDATVVTDGFAVTRNLVQDAKEDVIQWVDRLGGSDDFDSRG